MFEDLTIKLYRNLKNWEWKYKGKNTFGKSIVFVATNNQKILATFSIIPLKYKIMGRIVNGSCSIAMIVHPKYQNKGLIKFVADKLFEWIDLFLQKKFFDHY